MKSENNKFENIYNEIREKKNRLRGRWQSESAQDLIDKILSAIRAGNDWVQYLSNFLDADEIEDRLDLRGAPLVGQDLSRSNLHKVAFDFADLRDANLSTADCQEANFNWADLSGADLTETNLQNCSMVRVELRATKLIKANLKNAVLLGADLKNANFSYADLTNAGLRGAKTEGMILDGAILINTDQGKVAEE